MDLSSPLFGRHFLRLLWDKSFGIFERMVPFSESPLLVILFEHVLGFLRLSVTSANVTFSESLIGRFWKRAGFRYRVTRRYPPPILDVWKCSSPTGLALGCECLYFQRGGGIIIFLENVLNCASPLKQRKVKKLEFEKTSLTICRFKRYARATGEWRPKFVFLVKVYTTPIYRRVQNSGIMIGNKSRRRDFFLIRWYQELFLIRNSDDDRKKLLDTESILI